MTRQPLVAAGFWRRYAAWSLDAVPVLSLACLLTRTQLQATGVALAGTSHALADRLATTMLHAFDQDGGVLPATLALAFDPRLRDGSRALVAALGRGLQTTVVVFAVLMLLQHVAFEQSRWRGTPGKRVLGLVVADMQGAAPSLVRSLLRNLAGVLSWLSLNAGHALAAVPPQHRALHDYIGGTRVLASPVPLPRWARAWLLAQAVLSLLLLGVVTTWMQGALDAALIRALGQVPSAAGQAATASPRGAPPSPLTSRHSAYMTPNITT